MGPLMMILVACHQKTCDGLLRSTDIVDWSYFSYTDVYGPDTTKYYRSDLTREELLCLLDTDEYWVAAHVMLTEGLGETGGIQERFDSPQGVVFDWYGLAVLDGRSGFVPDERSKPCLRRAWREEPPAPWRCWQEVVGTTP